ncbi:hypothetical protein AAFG07_23495 [Bradyrhizobium sp. B097]|uniref:hypothetical protein n=1 Tax=Bradyrhizobium sp. B097 TaxID=3140244 RepID=UPI0031840030
MKNIPPNSEATLFVAVDTPLEQSQIRVNSSSAITSFEDTKFVRRDIWSPSTLFSSGFSALLYLTFGLYMAARDRRTAAEAAALRQRITRLDENTERLKAETKEDMDDVKWRLMKVRVHMARHIARQHEELMVWRRFFRAIYTAVFHNKSDADPAMEHMLKLAGVHMTKRLREYSEPEFLEILEEAERSKRRVD